jgi:hypothetical protein
MATRGAGNTKYEEFASLYMFYSIIDGNKDLSRDRAELLLNVENILSYTTYGNNPVAVSEWYRTFEMQAEELKRYLGSNKGYSYGYPDFNKIGTLGNLLPDKTYIHDFILSEFPLPAQKDTWNPGDVVIIKKNKEREIRDTFHELLEDISVYNGSSDYGQVTLGVVNAQLRRFAQTKDLLYISLKKVSKSGSFHIEETNFSHRMDILPIDETLEFTLDDDLDISFNLVEERSGNKKVLMFDTSSLKWKQREVSSRIVTGGEARKTTRGARASGSTGGGIVIELKDKGTAAQLGGIVKEEIDDFFRKNGLTQLVKKNVSDPKIPSRPNGWTREQINFWQDLISKLSSATIGGHKINLRGGPKIRGKKVTAEALMKSCVMLDNVQESDDFSWEFRAKLNLLRLVDAFYEMDRRGKLSQLLTFMYLSSKKAWNVDGDKAPFIKIGEIGRT